MRARSTRSETLVEEGWNRICELMRRQSRFRGFEFRVDLCYKNLGHDGLPWGFGRVDVFPAER